MSRPRINGLSPQMVHPGAKITIRGENLGTSIDDLLNLYIFGQDCKPFIEFHSDKRIIAYVGKEPDLNDPFVIPVTRSGGEGDCSLKLELLDKVERVGALHEVPLWMDENISFDDVVTNRDRTSSQSHSNRNMFGLGVPFNSSEKTPQSDPTSAEFDPVKYLLAHHKSMTTSELEKGTTFLREQCGQHTNTDIEFVKTNIDVLLTCYATLEKVNKCIDEEEARTTGGTITCPLDTVLRECNNCANLLFSHILTKKDKADRIRNALNVIERFGFLFGLPDSIDTNIARKEYDIVLNDYKKAQSLFADTQVKVFKQVMCGVKGKIVAFSRELEKRLLEPRRPLSEKKQLLKYLIEFDCASTKDPAWDYLHKQQQQIIGYMTSTKIDFDNKLLEFVSLAMIKASRGNADHEEKISPLINEFVDELCDTVTQSLPDFWSLCQAYLDGSLLPETSHRPSLTHQDSVLSPPLTPRLSPPPNRSIQKEGEIYLLITAVIDLLTSSVRTYCADMDLKFNSLTDREHAANMLRLSMYIWSPTTVKRIRICVEKLLSISIPHHCLESIVELINTLRQSCVKCLFRHTEENIRGLHTRENWQISQERGHTALPFLFQNIVLSLLAAVSDVLEPVKMIEENPVQELKTDIQHMFYDVVISFADCLKYLTDVIENAKSTDAGGIYPEESADVSGIKTEERLVLILGNCRHTILTIIPILLRTFKSHGYIANSDDSIDNKSLEQYSNLERSIFDKYVNSKESFVFGDIQQFLDPNSFPWHNCNFPVAVNSYVQELALKLVMAQAELQNIEKDLLKRIIGHLLENVTVRVCGTISEVERFSKNGAVQAKLDLQTCLALFKDNMSQKCRRTMEDTMNSIPSAEITTEDETVMKMLLEKFKNQNSVVFSCLNYNLNTEATLSPEDSVLEQSVTQQSDTEEEPPPQKPKPVSLNRASSIKRGAGGAGEALDRVPSLRKSVFQKGVTPDSITRSRSQKRVKNKGIRSPPSGLQI